MIAARMTGVNVRKMVDRLKSIVYYIIVVF